MIVDHHEEIIGIDTEEEIVETEGTAIVIEGIETDEDTEEDAADREVIIPQDLIVRIVHDPEGNGAEARVQRAHQIEANQVVID